MTPINQSINQSKSSLQEYLCCAEYPNALCALALIAEEVLNLFTPQQRRIEVERFRYKLEEILNHSRNTDCLGRARVLMFDGKCLQGYKCSDIYMYDCVFAFI